MQFVTHRGQPYEYEETESGAKLFSVSQVRKVAHDPYKGIPEAVLETARLRGTALHSRFWKVLAAQVDLCPMPLPLPGLEGYCLSMDQWVTRHQVKPLLLETTSASLKYGYAGTPDALVQYGPKQIVTLLDLKTGAPTKTDAMQLLAYQKMPGYESAKQLLDIYVDAEGGEAKESPVSKGQQVTEWAWFMNALGVLISRANHGV